MFGLFGKKTGDGDNQREHHRHSAAGEKVRILDQEFPLGDLSLGGMRVEDYDDDTTRVNQYFEFHLLIPQDGKERELRGHAQVARVGDGFMGAKFTTPQPELQFEVKKYLESKG